MVGWRSNSFNYVTEPGNYYVDVYNAKGCPGYSDTLTIVSPGTGSSPDISISGPTEFCEGESTMLSVPANFNGYAWNAGSNTTEQEVTTQGNYFVAVIGTSGCELHSDTVSIMVHPASEPSALLLSNVLTTDSGFASWLASLIR